MTVGLPDGLVALLGYEPRDPALFLDALTHGSHNVHGRAGDYQRLEFLGDRVLGLVIADALYHRFPGDSEGQLSARLNALVARSACGEVARAIGLPPMVRLGRQARDDGGRDSDNILGDVVEALIGALYLDGGIEAARRFILANWDARIAEASVTRKHPKTALLEWAAARRRKPPQYTILRRDGPDHAPRFTIGVEVANVGTASGEGTSRQEAETAAAAALLEQIGQKK